MLTTCNIKNTVNITENLICGNSTTTFLFTFVFMLLPLGAANSFGMHSGDEEKNEEYMPHHLGIGAPEDKLCILDDQKCYCNVTNVQWVFSTL